ncbi:MAG: lysophospholipid acyltransferase family protein [Candidatus Omnitrophota bacterium]
MKIKTRRYYLYYLAAIGVLLINLLPLRFALYLADLAGRIAFFAAKKDRQRAIDNLSRAFPEKKDLEIEQIAKRVFSNLCKNAIELVCIRKFDKKNLERWYKAEGFEKVLRACEKGKGVLMLTAHVGNWELMPFYYVWKKIICHAIARHIYFDRYDKFIANVRSYIGVNVIYRDESPKKILKTLKRNELIGILADQDVDSVDGVFVDFFGRPAYTPKAPVALAMASGASFIPCFLIREKNCHKLIVDEPIVFENKSSKEETIRFYTQKWSKVLESYIRRYPDQWVWMHNRWKTQPQGELSASPK